MPRKKALKVNCRYPESLSLQIILSLMILSLSACYLPNDNLNALSEASADPIPDLIDFNFHVKPILSDRCFKCHGPDENSREAGLRLDTPEGAFAALGESKDHYAIIPEKVEESTLVDRIFTSDPIEVMPPPSSNLTLSENEKIILKKWIAQGAEWKSHWSFLPLEKPELPNVKDQEWANNEIDYFILAQLEKNNLSPNPAAAKEQLARRVFFDLTGLPPNLEELDRFIQDTRPDAYERLLDSLLQSIGYAENQTIAWLDLARYADTHGYQDDLERSMWPWRDWVIHAFDQNMPYDQFVRWQLAGDLMPNANKEQIIATAFNRNHKITQEGGVIDEEYRVEYVADRTQTFGTAFLGLTFECARCHDHKYDPIRQEDYFSLFSFFNNVPEKGLIEEYFTTPKPYLNISKKDIAATLKFIQQLEEDQDTVALMVMEESSPPRKTFILERGAYDQPSKEVFPNMPKGILAYNSELPKNRLGLADWLFDKKNPLTSRVLVNRLWQQCFGKGIVATPYDLGSQGALPTHPELLDWLAIYIQEKNWDLKQTLKYLLLSATYQQSNKRSVEQQQIDPSNDWLSYASRRRLGAESIRDHFLKISGQLITKVGGPSVKPYQPEGLWEEKTGGGGGSTAKYIPDEGEKLYRRSLYTFWKRTVPPPNMITFDAASRDICTVLRQQTSTPLQALVMMNDPQYIEAGRALANRAIQKHDNLQDRIKFMVRLSLSRSPTELELSELSSFFAAEEQRFKENPKDAEAFTKIRPFVASAEIPVVTLATYSLLANAIFNLDESISK